MYNYNRLNTLCLYKLIEFSKSHLLGASKYLNTALILDTLFFITSSLGLLEERGCTFISVKRIHVYISKN